MRFSKSLLPTLLIALAVTGCSKRRDSLVIAFSNDTMGQIRSCGCAANDYGGLGRRATLVSVARDTSQNFLLFDGGDFFGTEINYGKEKAEVTLKSMAIMGYDGIVLGEKDFGFGLEYVKDRCKEIGLPVLLANLFDAKSDTLLFRARKILTLSKGLRVAVLGVVSDKIKWPPQVDREEMRVRSPEKILLGEVEAIRAEVDVVVVLAHMPISEAVRLAQRVSGIDVMICGHEGKPLKRAATFGGAYLLQAPKRGKFMGLAYCVLDGERRIENLVTDIRPLSQAYPDYQAIAKLFKAYDMDIAVKEKAGIPVGALSRGKGPEKPFAGAKRCSDCHKEIFELWEHTKHANAFSVLEEKGRQFDRDCTPCHTTGFYKLGGFVSVASTPELTNVQCEACHGNGYEHARNPKRRTKENAKTVCGGCHTKDQSPGFSFEGSWPRVEHGKRPNGQSNN